MTNHASICFIALLASLTSVPRELSAQESAGEEQKKASPFTPADGLLDKAANDIASFGRCLDMRADLLAQVKPPEGILNPPAPKAASIKPPAPDPAWDPRLVAASVEKAYAAKKKRIAEDCAGKTAPQELIASGLDSWDEGNSVPYALSYYYTCLALARQDSGSCEALKAIPTQTSPDSPQSRGPAAAYDPVTACAYHSNRLMSSKLLISRDPSFMKHCPATQDAKDPAEAAQSCRTILKGEKDPAAVCASQEVKSVMDDNAKRFKDSGAGCEAGIRFFWGTGQSCADSFKPAARGTMSPDAVVERRLACQAVSATPAFRKAFESRNIALCGDSPFCRVMMGEGAKACEGYARQAADAKAKFCAAAAQWPAKAPDYEKTAILETEKKRAEWLKAKERYDREAGQRLAEERQASDRAADAWKKYSLKSDVVKSKLDQVEKVCLKLETDSLGELDGGLAAAVGVEPKSLPGIKQRKERYAELKAQLAELGGKIHASPPPARKRGKRKPPAASAKP